MGFQLEQEVAFQSGEDKLKRKPFNKDIFTKTNCLVSLISSCINIVLSIIMAIGVKKVC